MTITTKIIILSAALVFIAGCGAATQKTQTPAPDASVPEASSAAELVQKCKERISDLENKANTSDDPYEKAILCKLASEKGINCHKQGAEKFPDSSELPGMGRDAYNETTNYLCYCKNVIADKEIELNSEQDPVRKFELLKEKLQITIDCHKTFSSELHDPTKVPKIGRDDLGETTNLDVNCKRIIDILKEQIDSASSCEDRTELIQKMREIETWCMKEWAKPWYDPRKAARFGRDNYGTKDYYEECANPMKYGFPVCNPNNLPNECKPGDESPGWDCYTFEEAECSPKLRCFCIAPPEPMPAPAG